VEKTKNAVENLVKLNKNGLLQDVRLTAFYNKAKNNNSLGMVRFFTKLMTKNAEADLKSGSESVRKFNLWKLSQYIGLIEQD